MSWFNQNRLFQAMGSKSNTGQSNDSDSRTDQEIACTVVTIQIVGLPTLIDIYKPEIIFPHMRQLASLLASSVAKAGGELIDYSNRGFTCIFAGNSHFNGGIRGHADKALRWAVEVQTANVHNINTRSIASGGSTDEPVFCLKIGINSTRVYLGNVDIRQDTHQDGIPRRVAFGRGLDVGHELSDASEASTICFSKSTRDLLIEIDSKLAVFKSHITQTKSYPHGVETFHYDPFEAHPEVRSQAMEALRTCANLKRSQKRWAITSPHNFIAMTNSGPIQLTDISAAGMGFIAKQQITMGTVITIILDSTDGVLGKRLKARGIPAVSGEIRWSKNRDGQLHHGIVYQDLSVEMQELLVTLLLETNGQVKVKSAV